MVGIGAGVEGDRGDGGLEGNHTNNMMPATKMIAPINPVNFCRGAGIWIRSENRPARARNI